MRFKPQPPKFELGAVYCTTGVAELRKNDDAYTREVMLCLARHASGDFSDMEHPEDIALNEQAIRTGEDRILSVYNTSKGRIWIITEWDRSSTTILLPEEY